MKIAGVVLDWAGTIVDHGSRAPVEAVMAVFANAGVEISIPEARAPMGLAKKDHIDTVLKIPRVRSKWRELHGNSPSADDVETLYADFLPRQLEGLQRHADLIPGILGAVERMRSRNIAIGTTTGYTRPMLDFLLARALEQGFQPDASRCPDDVSKGRPAPWMCYQLAEHLNVYPMSTMVKIGDTPVDVAEGLNAGMWTIGLTRSGNEVGLTVEEWESAPEAEKLSLIASAEERLLAAGAHYVAGSLAECDGILDAIDERLQRGEQP